jgi:hypothetical protein
MPDPDSKTSVGKIVEIKGVVIDAVSRLPAQPGARLRSLTRARG